MQGHRGAEHGQDLTNPSPRLAKLWGRKALDNGAVSLHHQGFGEGFFLRVQCDVLISDFTQVLPLVEGSSSADKGSESTVSDCVSITRNILRLEAGAAQVIIFIIKTSYGSLCGVNERNYRSKDVQLIKNTCACTSTGQSPVGRNVKWGPTECPARSIRFNSFINNLEARPGVC